ncbi:Transposase IS4 [Popillia japonica]|uniref:Transposase IS4 n=1 Tax=Popillia japonica TaxID=7064 RepID=A0AAW1JFW1_POPJA
MRKGDHDGVIAGDISISKWKDRGHKAVCVISTMHNPLEETKVLRTQKDSSRESVSCPSAIADYNKYMGGVDRFDQLLAAYNISWKSRRWWMRIFHYCLESSMVNAYILYKTTVKESSKTIKPVSHLKFRSPLASQLILNYCSRKRRGPPAQYGRGRNRNRPNGHPTTYNIRLNNVGDHIPVEGTRRRCAYSAVHPLDVLERVKQHTLCYFSVEDEIQCVQADVALSQDILSIDDDELSGQEESVEIISDLSEYIYKKLEKKNCIQIKGPSNAGKTMNF